MLKLLVGDKDYYSALELYFKRHDGEAATIEDWIKVFEDVTNRDLTQFKRWYSQAGTPKVKFNVALSILEKLQVPEGWCSSGLKENEYTFTPGFAGTLV